MSSNDEDHDNDNVVFEEEEDEEEFLDSNDVVEVAVLDGTDDNVPMDDDDDDDDDIDNNDGDYNDDDDDDVIRVDDEEEEDNNANIVPPSKELFLEIASHTGAVYSCAILLLSQQQQQEAGMFVTATGFSEKESSVVSQQQSPLLLSSNAATTLFIASGGGDDCAYWSRFEYNDNVALSSLATVGEIDHQSVLTQRLSYQHTDSVSAVAFGTLQQQQQQKPTQYLLAVGGYDGMIVLYDGITGKCLMDITPEYKTNFAGPTDIEWMTFHKTGTVLLVGSSTDGTVWMYHIVPPTKNNIYYTLNCMQVFVGHASMVSNGGFTIDGRWAVTIGNSGTRDDATIRIWNPKTGIAKHTIHLHSGSTTGILATTTSNEYYDKSMDDDDDDNNAPSYAGLTCLAFGIADDGVTGTNVAATTSASGGSNKLVLVGSEDGWAYVCHVGTGKVLHAFRHAAEDSLYPPSSTTMDIENDNNNKNISTEPLLSVEAVGFCPSNTLWCATGGADGTLKIWDLHNGQCRHSCRFADHDTTATTKKSKMVGGITRLCWLQSPSSLMIEPTTHQHLFPPPPPLVFVATTDGMVHVWDARNGGLLLTLQTGGRATINDMQVTMLNNNRVIVVVASEDCTVRLFQLNLVELLQSRLS